MRMRSGDTFQVRARADAQAAPIWMIGPSRPSEPPDAMTAIEDDAAGERGPQPHRPPAERDHFDHVRDARERPLAEEEAGDQAAHETARSRHEDPGVERQHFGAPEDVPRARQQRRELLSQEPERDCAQAAEKPGGRGQDQELGVGIAPEEAAEDRGPGGSFRRAHSPSSYRWASFSSTSSSPPKKNACEQSVPQKVLPPMRFAQPSQTDLWQIGHRGSA